MGASAGLGPRPWARGRSALGLPNCSLNRRSFRSGSRPPCAIEQVTTGRREGGKREIGGSRASRASRQDAQHRHESSAHFPGKYFWFWSPKNKNAFSLPCRPSRLPAFLFSEGPRHEELPARQEPEAVVHRGLGTQWKLLQASCGWAATRCVESFASCGWAVQAPENRRF
jgi:hypothetical protein